MADTDVNAASLTVTITEALSVGHDTAADARDFAQTMTHTFASIANAAVSCPTDKASVKYIRVTNLDGTDALQVGLDDEDSDAGYTSVAAASSIMYTGTVVEGGNGGSTLDNATALKVKGVAGHQVEVFIASV
mgnify:CR=1 FL=1